MVVKANEQKNTSQKFLNLANLHINQVRSALHSNVTLKPRSQRS